MFLLKFPRPKPVKPVTGLRPLCAAAQRKLRYTFDQDEDSKEDSEVGMYVMITTHIMQVRQKWK